MIAWIKSQKVNKIALLLAGIHFLASFFTDRFMFQYVLLDFTSFKNTIRSIETIGVKIVFLILLFLFWQGLFWFFKKANCTFRNIAISYFVFMMILLLLIWPGIWRMDEFSILFSSVQLFPNFWQNYITSVFYIISIMMLPFPSGVIIVQCACIALIIARVITLCMSECKKWSVFILIIPFVMLPVLDSNLYPIRMSLYAFLEVLLLVELYFIAKKKKESIPIPVLMLAAVVTVWRTEAIYYVVWLPLILLLLTKNKRYLKQIGIYLILTVILFVPQKIGEKTESGDQYELTSVVLPLVPLVEKADQNQDNEILSVIDKVVNVDLIIEGAKQGRSGINLFWSEQDFQRDYSSEEFSKFKKAYYKLILKYPLVFLRERWQCFIDSSDLLENTTELFSKNDVPNYQNFQELPLSHPLSEQIRTDVIKKLELRSSGDYKQKLPWTDFVYSAVPAVIILLIAAATLLLKRKWLPLCIVLAVLIKVPLVFLTAPSRLFMYYYSVYLFGYCVLFYFAFKCINADRRKR